MSQEREHELSTDCWCGPDVEHVGSSGEAGPVPDDVPKRVAQAEGWLLTPEGVLYDGPRHAGHILSSAVPAVAEVFARADESLADRMRRAGWTERQVGAAMDAAGAAS